VENTREQPLGEAEAAPAAPNGENGFCTPSDTLSVHAAAAPDFDPDTPGTQVQAGTVVQLSGSCVEVIVMRDCDSTINDVSDFRWSLTFEPPAGVLTDITSNLQDANTLTPHFVASDEGTYRARLRGEHPRLGARASQVAITATPRPAVLLARTGTITFLRVHDVGTGFGPPTDSIDVEAVIKLNTAPTEAYGFQLRNDRHRPSHEGMLDLLRDAFFHNREVSIDYSIIPGRRNGVILRVALAV
jgi:hypothetical protein